MENWKPFFLNSISLSQESRVGNPSHTCTSLVNMKPVQTFMRSSLLAIWLLSNENISARSLYISSISLFTCDHNYKYNRQIGTRKNPYSWLVCTKRYVIGVSLGSRYVCLWNYRTTINLVTDGLYNTVPKIVLRDSSVKSAFYVIF